MALVDRIILAGTVALTTGTACAPSESFTTQKFLYTGCVTDVGPTTEIVSGKPESGKYVEVLLSQEGKLVRISAVGKASKDLPETNRGDQVQIKRFSIVHAPEGSQAKARKKLIKNEAASLEKQSWNLGPQNGITTSTSVKVTKPLGCESK